MSRIRIVQNPIDQALLARLVKELNAPEQQIAEGQPVGLEDDLVIIEEPTAPGRSAVVVVWDEWTGLESRDRGRLIMEAVREVRGAEAVNVSLAMGLTRAEYDRISGRAA